MTAYYTFDGNYNNQYETSLTGVGVGTSFVESFDGSKALMIPADREAMLSIPDGLIDQREMTLSFWVKDLNDCTGHIFHSVNTDQGFPSFLLSVESGRLKFVCTHYNVVYQYDKMRRFVHDELSGWHMITLVSDFNITDMSTITTRLYVDGAYTDKITEESNQFSESSGPDLYWNYNRCYKFIMGGGLTHDRALYLHLDAVHLTIDNLRVYKNRRLSDKEIKTIYNKEKQIE